MPSAVMSTHSDCVSYANVTLCSWLHVKLFVTHPCCIEFHGVENLSLFGLCWAAHYPNQYSATDVTALPISHVRLLGKCRLTWSGL